ncbi:hypothetical protein PILCRDRAFT_93559 [Piloderma croceum F 1598]|uniref:Uncharacterized protein n=1 Tax=Piloderma croceum (strain F 1598) TaxID=765440 RepID=A0A0C3B4H7_PILCF|nr:hypothetical protein PILCRDRAFT_93559 [Piloderma croceum F 1598]
MASDWVTPRYLGNGSGHPESHLQTPFLSGPPPPPLPPKPVELTSTGIPSSTKLPDCATPNPSTNTEDTLPSFYDRQSSLSTQSVHSQHLPAVSPPNEAPEPPAPNPLETPKSPKHVLQDELHESPVVPARAVSGRPTTKALGLIEEGFNKITEIIEGLAEVTGKPPSDLYRRLEKSRKGASEGHLWNIYLHYFARHEEEEAARLNRPLERTQTFRSRCYAQYKVNNANFRELLETYQELEMAGTEMTVGQRKREVEKYEKKLRDMAMEAYRTLDIDTFIMTAGSIILSDHGLFLCDKTGIEPNEAQAAFTAHIFNQKSMDSLAFARAEQPHSPRVKMEDPLSSGDSTSSSWLAAIKQKLYDMFQDFSVTISMSQFPWKSLLAVLAKHGLILSGFPDILLPGEVRSTNKTKGIGDLITTEQVDLATSLGLVGRTDFPISLLRAPQDQLDDIKSGLCPVIICRPPPPGAEAVRGRQAYYSLDDKIPVIRTDGRPRIAEDRRLPARAAPTRACVPDNKNIIRISSSSPPAKVQPAPHSSNDSSVVIASSPQPSARVPKKRKAHVDSSSLLSDDDDEYIADPKPKRSKAGQKAVVATGQQKREVGKNRKGKEVGNGKGKEKEKEKPARARQVKKTVKSVAFIDDEDDSSSDNKPPPATRPTPKPAYHAFNRPCSPTSHGIQPYLNLASHSNGFLS